MLGLNQLYNTAAAEIAAYVTPLNMKKLKAAGMSRATRRKLAHIYRRRIVKGTDIPQWFVMDAIMGKANA